MIIQSLPRQHVIQLQLLNIKSDRTDNIATFLSSQNTNTKSESNA